MTTAQLSLTLTTPPPQDPRATVLDAVEAFARERRAAVVASGDVWAPPSWIERGFDPNETERGRFDRVVLDAIACVGLPHVAPSPDGPDLISDDPLWSEAWQRFVAPRDPDGAVRCVVSREVTRVDLRARGVLYLGAAVHDSGGVFRRATLDTLAVWHDRRLREPIPEHRRERWPLRLWVTKTARHSAGFNVPAECVEILRLSERDATAEKEKR